jgi:hypothetical protein
MPSTRARRDGRANRCRARNQSITVEKRCLRTPSHSLSTWRRYHSSRPPPAPHADGRTRGKWPSDADSGFRHCSSTTHHRRRARKWRGGGGGEVLAFALWDAWREMYEVYLLTGSTPQWGERRPAQRLAFACVRWVSLAGASSAAIVPSRARAPRRGGERGGVLRVPSCRPWRVGRCRPQLRRAPQPRSSQLSSRGSRTMDGSGAAPARAAGAAAPRQSLPRAGADTHTTSSW